MQRSHSPLAYDTSYPPARGPVLLLTCMDLRLMDEIVNFMNHDGLNNRYDHLVMAGAALGALGAGQPDRKHWRKTFRDHFEAASALHHIEDVYIIEHRNCGAYRVYLGADGEFSDCEAEKEAATHYKYASKLERRICRWAKKMDIPIRVRSFLMDLRGSVTPLVRSHQ